MLHLSVHSSVFCIELCFHEHRAVHDSTHNPKLQCPSNKIEQQSKCFSFFFNGLTIKWIGRDRSWLIWSESPTNFITPVFIPPVMIQAPRRDKKIESENEIRRSFYPLFERLLKDPVEMLVIISVSCYNLWHLQWSKWPTVDAKKETHRHCFRRELLVFFFCYELRYTILRSTNLLYEKLKNQVEHE